MNCQTAVELLPWFLNGSLEEAESRPLEAHLNACEGCREELAATQAAAAIYEAHPSAGALIAFAAGEDSTGPSRELIELHLSRCPTCTEEVALLRQGRSALELEAVDRREEARESPRGKVLPGRWPARRWQQLAAAAGIATVVLSGGLTWRLLSTASQLGRVAEERSTADARVTELEDELDTLRDAQAEGAEPTAAERERIESLEAEREKARKESEEARKGAASRIAELEARASGPRLSFSADSELYPEGAEPVHRGTEPAPEVSCVGDPCTLLVALSQEAAADRIRVRILARDGSPWWEEVLEGARGQQVVLLTLDRGRLPAGPLEIEAWGEGEGEPVSLGRYRVNLR